MYCLNPACAAPENSGDCHFCQSCGAALGQEFVFRDRYHVVRILGQGSFGRTYQAKDSERLDGSCVIKKFIGQGAKAEELFQREAQGLYQLGEHPQIPILYAAFTFQNSLYLVQQFIEGMNLFEEYEARGRFSEAEILKLLQDLLPVLQFVHDAKILHRDIKPDNIMRRKSDGKLVLIDFGGVKQANTTMQGATGTVLYTSGYAAIEHMMGKPDHTSDLYSLAATCVRLLTGCFPETDVYGDLHDELYDTSQFSWQWREVLQRQGRSVSDRLGQTLDRMLQKTPQSRYQSVEEVLNALSESTSPPPSIKSLDSTLTSLFTSELEINLHTHHADYTKLQALLKVQKWEEADLETAKIMLKVAGREQQKYFNRKSIEQFPSEVLEMIDHLWVKHSKRRFGFSVQKKIWKRVGGMRKFSETVGWLVDNKWLSYDQLIFTLEDEDEIFKGKLPCLVWFCMSYRLFGFGWGWLLWDAFISCIDL